LIITVASLAVPSRSGTQVKPGALTTCQSAFDFGLKTSGRIKSARPNSACQAYSGGHLDRQVVLWIGADVQVRHERFGACQVILYAIPQRAE
jgi:hypothetical protein